MAIIRLEHLGIAVEDLAQSRSIFDLLLGTEPYQEEQVVSENVTTLFYQTGESKIELVAATDPNEPNAISKYLEKRGPGIHHVAFEVDDIYEAMEDAKSKGFVLLQDEPKLGADNKLICFLHPKSTGGVLVEFCMTI